MKRDEIAEIICEAMMHEVRAITDPEHKIKVPEPFAYTDKILSTLTKDFEVVEECLFNDHTLCGANEHGVGDCYNPNEVSCEGSGTITRQATIQDLDNLKSGEMICLRKI